MKEEGKQIDWNNNKVEKRDRAKDRVEEFDKRSRGLGMETGDLRLSFRLQKLFK